MKSYRALMFATLAVFAVMAVSIKYGTATPGDPQAGLHWYAVHLSYGSSTETFTGSSTLDPARMGASVLSGGVPVELDNLRDYGIWMDSKAGKAEWREYSGKGKVFILPKNVVYFFELAGDPLKATTEAGKTDGK